MKRLFSALILGSAIAFTAGSAFAQEAQTTQAGAANTPAKKKTHAAAALTSGQYAGEAEAKEACAGDAVVWAISAPKAITTPAPCIRQDQTRRIYVRESHRSRRISRCQE